MFNHGNKPLCDEKIIAVYHGRPASPSSDSGMGAFLDCYHPDISLHLAPYNRLVLETEHSFISVEPTGTVIQDKVISIGEFERRGEWLYSYVDNSMLEDDDDPWIDFTATLLIGETLKCIVSTGIGYSLVFDDFSVEIIPHDSFDMNFPTCRDDPRRFQRVFGAERLIKRKCVCGGTGELMIDFLSEYGVVCPKCRLSSWGWTADEAIDCWNSNLVSPLLH